MNFTNKDGIRVVDQVIHIVQENRDYLSQIDGEAGDGDHGINMNKGMAFARKELEKNDSNMSQGFITISKILIEKIGGSMGPLYGSFFDGLGSVSKEKEVIDTQVMSEMFQEAYENLSDLTDAKPGDKSLMDVLIPAIEAYESRKQNFKEALEAMEEAAREGLESTRMMIAKVGRASRLGERSKGHLDAGAASCCLILTAICQASLTLLEGSGAGRVYRTKNE